MRLGKLQSRILGILNGSAPTKYAAGGQELTTAELLEELVYAGLLSRYAIRSAQFVTVRRACQTLAQRKLISGSCPTEAESPHRTEAWSIVQRPTS